MMMERARVLLRSTVLLALLVPGQAMGQQSTAEVADEYLELTLNQRFDQLLQAYAEDAVFFDPTAEVFQGSVADGPVRGARSIVAMERGWGILESEFDVAGHFAVGPFALYHGTYKARYEASAPWTNIPFVTVLRVKDGRVSERTDFGEYVESFGLGSAFDEATAQTREISRRYLDAYLSADLEAQRALLAPNARFQDPTAQVYGPNAGHVLDGRDTILERRRATFQNVIDFGLDVSDSFVANHHAVYIGATEYTLKNGAHFRQPAVFVVEVRDGQVTRHWDFVDYSVGPVGQDGARATAHRRRPPPGDDQGERSPKGT